MAASVPDELLLLVELVLLELVVELVLELVVVLDDELLELEELELEVVDDPLLPPEPVGPPPPHAPNTDTTKYKAGTRQNFKSCIINLTGFGISTGQSRSQKLLVCSQHNVLNSKTLTSATIRCSGLTFRFGLGLSTFALVIAGIFRVGVPSFTVVEGTKYLRAITKALSHLAFI